MNGSLDAASYPAFDRNPSSSSTHPLLTSKGVSPHAGFMAAGYEASEIRAYGWRRSGRSFIAEVEFEDGTLDVEETSTFDGAMDWLASQL